MEPISIVCWKWAQPTDAPTTKKHTRFTSAHVNALYEMLCKHVSIPFKLICVTDDPEGIQSEIQTIPLWDEWRHLGGCFTRLVCFKKDFALFGKRFVSIDLDCIILQDITPILKRRGDFIIWKPEDPMHRIATYCGSLWMMNAGARPQVYNEFDPIMIRPKRNGKYLGGTDQLHISRVLRDEKLFTARDGVYNFVPDVVMQVRPLPSNTRIVFFNGRYMPDDIHLANRYPWIKTAYPLAGQYVPEYNPEQDLSRIERSKRMKLKKESVPKALRPEKVEKPKEQRVPSWNIVLFWWGNWPGDFDGKIYIQKLLNGLNQYLPKSYSCRIVLYTDQPGIQFPGLEVRELKLPENYRWNLKKMFMFSPDAGLSGPTICFDLDCIITSDLTPLIEALENKTREDWLFTCQAVYQSKKIGGSIVGFYSSNRLTKLFWNPLLSNRKEIENATKGSERYYYRQRIPRKHVAYWEDRIPGKVVSFKRDCQNGIPEDAAVIRFHGTPRPHEAHVPWIAAKWREL